MGRWFLVSISLLFSRRNIFDALLADLIVTPELSLRDRLNKIIKHGFPSSLHPSLI
jgi:hypothetical protein